MRKDGNAAHAPIKVAVEEGLTPVRKALSDAGFIVIGLDGHEWQGAQAIVVNGMDDNFLGMEDPMSQSPIIDADGMTPEEVVSAVRERAVGL